MGQHGPQREKKKCVCHVLGDIHTNLVHTGPSPHLTSIRAKDSRCIWMYPDLYEESSKTKSGLLYRLRCQFNHYIQPLHDTQKITAVEYHSKWWMMCLGADPSELIRMWHAREGQTFATHSSRKMQCPCVADRVERAKASRRLRTAGRPNTVCHVWGLTIRPRGGTWGPRFTRRD